MAASALSVQPQLAHAYAARGNSSSVVINTGRASVVANAGAVRSPNMFSPESVSKCVPATPAPAARGAGEPSHKSIRREREGRAETVGARDRNERSSAQCTQAGHTRRRSEQSREPEALEAARDLSSERRGTSDQGSRDDELCDRDRRGADARADRETGSSSRLRTERRQVAHRPAPTCTRRERVRAGTTPPARAMSAIAVPWRGAVWPPSFSWVTRCRVRHFQARASG